MAEEVKWNNPTARVSGHGAALPSLRILRELPPETRVAVAGNAGTGFGWTIIRTYDFSDHLRIRASELNTF